MRSFRHGGLLALSLMSFSGPAFAGAWTQPKGAGQAILTTRYYTTDRYVDDEGRTFDTPDYRKIEVNPYLEYGVTGTTTVGASLFLLDVTQDMTAGDDARSAGLGDGELFVRQQLYSDGRFVASVQGGVTLPSPLETRKFPSLGSDAASTELRLLGGMSETVAGHPAYLDAEVAYRRRSGSSGDQWRYELGGGVDVTDRWQGIVQVFGTHPASGIDVTFAGIDEASDYHLVQVQLSALYRVTNRWGVQFGLYCDVFARNTGEGEGMLLALRTTF